MKEAIAMLHMYCNIFKVDINFLLTVHDECVVDFPETELELVDKVKELMKRAANNYLIPEIQMDVDCRIAKYWKK